MEDDERSLTPAEALAEADRVRDRVHGRANWYVWFCLVYAAGSLVAVASLGIWPGPVTAIAVGVGWAVFVTVISVYANLQPVQGRGYARRHLAMILVWSVLYVGVLMGGLYWFPGSVAWFLGGAVVTALVPLVFGVTAYRAAGSGAGRAGALSDAG